MANEFVIKNGYLSRGDSEITGSLNVTGSVTASAANIDNETKSSIYLNKQTLTSNQTVEQTFNGMLAGPISVSESINLIVQTDSTLVIL